MSQIVAKMIALIGVHSSTKAWIYLEKELLNIRIALPYNIKASEKILNGKFKNLLYHTHTDNQNIEKTYFWECLVLTVVFVDNGFQNGSFIQQQWNRVISKAAP